MDGCERESRSRISNIYPCGLRLGRSTASHAHSLRLHGPHRLHSTDRPNHQLAVCYATLGRPPQRKMTSMCHSDDPKTISHEPTPASASASGPPAAAITEPRYLAFTESRHDVVVRAAGTHSAVRAARHVDRVPPRIESPPLAPATGAGMPEPGNTASASALVLLPCRPRRRQGPQSRVECRPGQRRRRRRRVSLARPEMGRAGV